MNKAAGIDGERFQNGASKYAAFLETPEGRLRSDLAFANLEDFLSSFRDTESLRALDIGCGTGAAGVRLARLGIQVTLLDSSAEMLNIAERAARDAGLFERTTLKYGGASQLTEFFSGESFDIILCHNVLEYVEDPDGVLRAAAGLLRDSSAIFSVLVRNQAGEVMKAAIQAGNLASAEDYLTAEWGNESLYGGSVRLFKPGGLRAMLNAAAMTLTTERGVRVISDYLPPQISRDADYDRIFKLERKLGCRPEFVGIARYTQCIAQRADRATGVGS
jgi:2-polyprenyl-3-methyl-5-hydroxy-6-metoxy-1,4-benzoquinol methylase